MGGSGCGRVLHQVCGKGLGKSCDRAGWVFTSRAGGGGGSIEPPKTGREGFGKGAQLTGPLISYY